MNEPRRMLHGGDAELEALLGAARDDGPSLADRRAVAAAIGLSLVATAATTAATATAALTSATSATSAASASSGVGASGALSLHVGSGKLGGLFLWKLAGGLALAFSLGVATGVRVQNVRSANGPSASQPIVAGARAVRALRANPVAPSAVPGASEPEPPPAAEVASAAPVDGTSSPAAPAAPSAPSAPAAQTLTPTHAPLAIVAPPSGPSVAPAPAASMLAQETRLLERARRAVAGHAYVDAIAALDAYDVLAPSGVLVQEARALRVQAMAEQGKRLAALDLGRAFLADFPASPYAKRVKAIVDALDATSNP